MTPGGGAAVAVSLTFDLDAEAGCLGQSRDYLSRLTSLSDARYGVVRGLPRILSVLERFSLPATFYVPGYTAEQHPDAVKSILAAGHEVAHHGYLHRMSHLLDEADQREELVKGVEALEKCSGMRPNGYRSPGWELTPETLTMLVELGFGYDSSCMGDDRPYFERHRGYSILELPIHWSLDDWPYFGSGRHVGRDAVLELWWEALEAAAVEHRHVTFTMHPEVVGRTHLLPLLEQLVSRALASFDVLFATHSTIASAYDSWTGPRDDAISRLD
jgi:peptidoglycan/xylan/chitin deacetylase (PgdA/CDA1 family)